MSELYEKARHIGYEWAMLLGAADTEWHSDKIGALNLTERAPLRAVHLHARTELVWLHARVLYDFLFKRKARPSVTLFLDMQARLDWKKKKGLTALDLCPTVHLNIGRANEKLFHMTCERLTDAEGLPGYDIVCKDLGRAYSTCYGLMVDGKRDAFRAGLDDEWDIVDAVLS